MALGKTHTALLGRAQVPSDAHSPLGPRLMMPRTCPFPPGSESRAPLRLLGPISHFTDDEAEAGGKELVHYALEQRPFWELPK